jgi:hypothetical protein
MGADNPIALFLQAAPIGGFAHMIAGCALWSVVRVPVSGGFGGGWPGLLAVRRCRSGQAAGRP